MQDRYQNLFFYSTKPQMVEGLVTQKGKWQCIKHIVTAIIFISVLLSTTFSAAEEKKLYIIGVENINYMPFYDGSVGDEFTGFSRDVLDLFAKKENIAFEYVTFPIPTLHYAFSRARDLDFKYPNNPDWLANWLTAQEKASIIYSHPDIITRTGIVTNKRDDGMLLEECGRFGHVRGFTPRSFFPLIEAGVLTPITTTNSLNLLKAALGDRVDCIYISEDVVRYMSKHLLNKPGALVFQDHLPFDLTTFSLSSIRHGDIIQKYNHFLITERQAIYEVAKKYGIPPSTISKTSNIYPESIN